MDLSHEALVRPSRDLSPPFTPLAPRLVASAGDGLVQALLQQPHLRRWTPKEERQEGEQDRCERTPWMADDGRTNIT